MAILVPGTTFDDRFQIIDLIGEGGMGCVYRALEVDLNRTVAIKVLNTALVADAESYQRFKQEGNLLANLSHPGILTVFKFGRFEGMSYIVMELLAGRSLRTELNSNGRLVPERVLNLSRQLCDALEYAHQQKVIHRDLKPDNIILMQDSGREVCKIIDFGLARVMSDRHSQRLTETGLLIGSVNYMSPEQCKGAPADHRSDIYSLGCLLYESLSGRPPYEADNPIGVMHHHVNASVPNLETIENHTYWNVILHKAMDKNPPDRYQSMAAMNCDLEAMQGGRMTQLLSSRKQRTDGRRKLALIILLAFLTVVVCTIPQLRRASPVEPPQKIPGAMMSSRWIHDYSKNRNAIAEEKRVPTLRLWLAKFGNQQEEAAVGHFWLCMEMLERASDVQYAPSLPGSPFSLASPVEQLNEAQSERRAALTLIEKLLNKGASLRVSKPVLLYYKLNLELLDASPSRQERICKAFKPDCECEKLTDRLRERLQHLYLSAGEYLQEEEMIHGRQTNDAHARLLLAENLTRQGRHSESRTILKSLHQQLQNGRWAQAAKRYIHYLAQLFIAEGLFAEAIETCSNCVDLDHDAFDEHNFYRKQSRKCNDPNNHAYLEAVALASLHKRDEALRLAEKISFEDLSTRVRILGPALLLLDSLHARPRILLGDRLQKHMDQNDIQWLTDIASVLEFGQRSERFFLPKDRTGGGHKANARKAIDRAAQTARRMVNSPKLDVESINRICLLLTAMGRPADARQLAESLIRANSLELHQDGIKRAFAIEVLNARTLFETGKAQHAAALLAEMPKFNSMPGYNDCQRYQFEAAILSAKILLAEGQSDGAAQIYEKTLKRWRHSLDVSRFQKYQTWYEYAAICTKLKQDKAAALALKECNRLLAPGLSGIIDVDIDR
jgi:serine/threonine protein kinase